MAAADPKTSLIERLFAEHGGALQAFFRRRIRSKSDAPDLVQEVYVRMMRVSHQESIRNPVLYLYTVANNLVKERAVLERQRGQRVEIDETEPHDELTLHPEFEGECDAALRARRLRMVLEQLRPKCKAAVVLRFAHGLSYREVGLRLGISAQMARKHVVQALTHCRLRMGRMG
jgi:RNA polymerase sigma factor (sigma-70 family)